MKIDQRKVKIEINRRGQLGSNGPTISDESYKIVKIFNCSESSIVGNTAHLSTIDDNTVIVNSDNKSFEPTIGVIIEKVTATTCKVLILGESIITFAGLQKGKKVFLAPSGGLTNSVPTDGYVQILGYSHIDTKVYINVSKDRLKREPF